MKRFILILIFCFSCSTAFAFSYDVNIPVKKEVIENFSLLKDGVLEAFYSPDGLTITKIETSRNISNAEKLAYVASIRSFNPPASKRQKALQYLKSVDISDNANVDPITLKRVLRSIAIVQGLDKEDVDG